MRLTRKENLGMRSRRYTLAEGMLSGRLRLLAGEIGQDVATRVVRRLLAGRVSALYVEETSSSITLRLVPSGPVKPTASLPELL